MAPAMPDDGRARLLELIWAGTLSQAVCAAVQLGLPQALADGPATVAEIAARCGAHPGHTARLVRALSGAGVLRRAGTGAYALAPAGEALLVEDEDGSSLAGMALFAGGGVLAGARVSLADAIRSGQGAFRRAYGTDLYAAMEADPDLARAYERWNGYGAGVDLEGEAMTAAYDFTAARHIVDVGGRYGTLLAHLLRSVPAARGTLLDLPSAVGDAPAHLQRAGVGDRCAVVAGSFFDAVPAGGDLYLLARVLVDWDDERAAAILRAVGDAMPAGAVVVVVETILDEDDLEAPFASLYNLSLMLHAGGLRTEAEHRALLAAAGFAVRRVVPTGSPVTTLIEAGRA